MRDRLRSERKTRKWTQPQIAEQIGVTVRTYQNYESGHRTPSLEVANKLEDLFGLPQRELLIDSGRTDSVQHNTA